MCSRWITLLLVIGCFLALPSLVHADDPPRLDLQLTFSKDGGKTYSNEFPVLSEPAVVKVRVNWDHVRPPNEKDVYITTIVSEQGDFASANVGRQTWSNVAAWYQRPTPYYLPAFEKQQFEYDLDVRARPEGVMGFQNRWDKDANKYADGPLPMCPALGKGMHRFSVRISYMLKNVTPSQRVEGKADFALIMSGPATQPAAAK